MPSSPFSTRMHNHFRRLLFFCTEIIMTDTPISKFLATMIKPKADARIEQVEGKITNISLSDLKLLLYEIALKR